MKRQRLKDATDESNGPAWKAIKAEDASADRDDHEVKDEDLDQIPQKSEAPFGVKEEKTSMMTTRRSAKGRPT